MRKILSKAGRYGGIFVHKNADINQLICLSNMENLNAVMIQDGIAQSERLRRLNEIAIHQMKVLASGMNSRRPLK